MAAFRQKIHALAQDAKYKGIWGFIKSKFYEHYYRLQFRRLGIVHPDGTFNLDNTISKSMNNDAHPNHASAYYHLRKVFQKVGLAKENINLLDIGCGDGRVLNLGIMLKFNKVSGIELDDIAVQKALDNCVCMHKHAFSTPFHIEKGDACNYHIPEEVNLIYLFNPFGKKTMEQVAENIMLHINRKNKEVYVAYCIPSYPEIFTQQPGCQVIYQSFNQDRSHSDLMIFKLQAVVA